MLPPGINLVKLTAAGSKKLVAGLHCDLRVERVLWELQRKWEKRLAENLIAAIRKLEKPLSA
jgi:hypothetical protein